jgi:hypothetical protein
MTRYLQEHRGATAGVVFAVLLVASVLVWRSTTSPAGAPSSGRRAFFSDDDGAGYFIDSADKLSPFERNGKLAYRAAVFTCDAGKTMFVGYLERYPEGARKQLQAARDAAASGGKDPPRPNMAMVSIEVKKPGPGRQWVSQNSRAGAEAVQVMCPPGAGGGAPEPVTP